MKFNNNEASYGWLTRLLHWVIALLIIGLIWLGWYMVDLSYYDRWYNDSLNWHKTLGMLVLALAFLKIGWQVYSPTPKPGNIAKLKPWEEIGAINMHRILLLLMCLIPITGYLISTSDGKPVSFMDLFDIPALFPISTSVRDWAIELHFYLAYGCGLLLLGHAGAAIKHEFIDKDRALRRMLWDE